MTKRTKLPVKQPDKNNANLWSFLKQCIGKELTRISMPVQWNEPISLLQRVAEYMNYAYLLKKAAVAKVSFIIQEVSQCVERILYKNSNPFNETFTGSKWMLQGFRICSK